MDPYALLAMAVEEGIIPGRVVSTSVDHCVHCGQEITYEPSVGEWMVNDGGCDSSDSGTHEPF